MGEVEDGHVRSDLYASNLDSLMAANVQQPARHLEEKGLECIVASETFTRVFNA